MENDKSNKSIITPLVNTYIYSTDIHEFTAGKLSYFKIEDVPYSFKILKNLNLPNKKADYIMVGGDSNFEKFSDNLHVLRTNILYGFNRTPNKISFMILMYLDDITIRLLFFTGYYPRNKELNALLTGLLSVALMANYDFINYNHSFVNKRATNFSTYVKKHKL